MAVVPVPVQLQIIIGLGKCRVRGMIGLKSSNSSRSSYCRQMIEAEGVGKEATLCGTRRVRKRLCTITDRPTPRLSSPSLGRGICVGKREKAADRSNDTNNHIVTKVIISSLFVFMVMTVSNVRICNDTQSQ
jgi:hypothetical protein